MGILGKLGCLVGSHDWSGWQYQHEGKCAVSRSCKRAGCGKVELTIAHPWKEWVYLLEDQCLQTHVCSRCGEEERRIEHLWDIWQYQSPTSCNQVRNCRRCKVVVETKIASLLASDHEVAPAELHKVTCLMKAGNCRRCKMPVTMALLIPEHEWGGWQQAPNGRRQRRCFKCGMMEYG
jgi:hypothetical protein